MYSYTLLIGLAALFPATLAEELDADDVPSACKIICQPIVDLTNTCDIDPKEAKKDNTGIGKRSKVEEEIEAYCICTNTSFDVAAVMGLCASCMGQNNKDTEDVDKMMSQCSFTSTSYVRSATTIVADINVQATKPATTIPGTTATAGAASSTTTAENEAESMIVSVVAVALAGVIAYNVAAFISTLFLLEFGADKFVDHTAIVARRTGIPDTVIALLTAGAEWEELVVIIASLAQGRPSLALGNIIGSAISNILGAFSLGLLFRPNIEFDRSSRIYSLFLLIITTFVTPTTYFAKRTIWLVCGSVLITLFAVYLISIGWAISRGSLVAPEDSDDDSSDDESDGSSTESIEPSVSRHNNPDGREERRIENRREGDPLLSNRPDMAVLPDAVGQRRRRSLGYHIALLVLGFAAICLASYVLSHAAINITDAIGISEVLFGMVILAIATTLPEKFVAVLSGSRGHVGILVANTVGSNVFLLLLCLGIVMVDTSGDFNGGNVSIAELCILWGSTLALTVTVWYGGRFGRWIGGAMLLCYVLFIALEFTIIQHS
ncbi:hypothetical protein FHETE_6368 [Fusarium heterosporum]|uniref:Sodium/calcium exchanger membrane region domain-containing protein n=1 Tax=Fusarium heterosporum TaxID=42747 RepID=A0A8H5TCH1_FUSHE|nr:hypothetical protein FHETE_6368 [Fusarium heterosporum]